MELPRVRDRVRAVVKSRAVVHVHTAGGRVLPRERGRAALRAESRRERGRSGRRLEQRERRGSGVELLRCRRRRHAQRTEAQ